MPNHLAFEVQDVSAPIGLTVDQEYQDGGIVLGDEPGLGIRVDEARIAALQVTDSLVAVAGPHVRPARAGLRLIPDDRREQRLGARAAEVTA